MAGLLGFLLGVVLMFFALSNQGKTPAAAATVTVTSAPTPAPTVTTTQSVAPQACVDALDQADKGFEIAGSAFQAAAKYDSTALGKASEQLKTLAPQYNATKAQCRAAK
jgi:ABC-type glycerol-3-phosphate transport system substrate-binding protein